MAKYKAPMGVKKTAKKAEQAKKDVQNKGVPRESTKRIVRQNTRGSVSLGDKMFGVYGQTATERKAEKVVQARREGERTRTASRAKGIAARQSAKAKAKRQARSLGN